MRFMASSRDVERTRMAQVMQLYRVALGRSADTGGLTAYFEQLQNGVPLALLAEDFVESEEFRRRSLPAVADSDARAIELYAAAYGAATAERVRLRHASELSTVAGLGAKLARLIELETDLGRLSDVPTLEGSVANDVAGYRLWSIWNDAVTEAEVQGTHLLADLRQQPLISLVLPIRGAEIQEFEQSINSVRAQIYWQVELILVGRPNAAASARIAELRKNDPWIRLVRPMPWTSQVQSLITAIKAARGEFVALLSEGDKLSERCALEVAKAVDRTKAVEIIYGDEDLIDADGDRARPWFKTDWDPDAMLAADQLGRSVFIRKALMVQAAPRRADDLAVWEYDLVLRAAENALPDAIHHIPAVLCHRAVASPVAGMEGRRRAVEAHLERTGQTGCFVTPAAAETLRIIRPTPQPELLVSIIVPTRDKANLLQTCVDGLLHRTDYPMFEIIIVDNGSEEAATKRLLGALAHDPRVRVLTYDQPFNWGAINNFAVAQARGEIVVLLNNDTDIIDRNWLSELVSQAVRPEVGVVGATLLYPDQTLQHAGIILAPGAAIDHLARHSPADDAGYRGRLAMVRAATAVTGACVALRRDVYVELGGVESANLCVAWSDTDLCLKAWERGYRVLMTPFARLFHLELATRGSDERPEAAARFNKERDWMRTRWGARLNVDPFFSQYHSFDMSQLILRPKAEGESVR